MHKVSLRHSASCDLLYADTDFYTDTLQFDSIFFVLTELRKHPNQALADRAWSVLELVYTATPVVDLKNSKIFSAMRHMTLSA